MASGLGDSAGNGLAAAPFAPIEGADDGAGVPGGIVAVPGVGGVIGVEAAGLDAMVGAAEGIGDGKSEETAFGIFGTSGSCRAAAGAVLCLLNNAVPIP